MALATGIRTDDNLGRTESVSGGKSVSPYNHACASMELGAFVNHTVFNAAKENEPADWQVLFNYEHGYVLMLVEQNNYKYARVLNSVAS